MPGSNSTAEIAAGGFEPTADSRLGISEAARDGSSSSAEDELIEETILVGEELERAAELAQTDAERASVMTGLADTPRLSETGIASDVLDALLPDEDVVVLPRVSRVSGGAAYRFAKRVFDVAPDRHACEIALTLRAATFLIKDWEVAA